MLHVLSYNIEKYGHSGRNRKQQQSKFTNFGENLCFFHATKCAITLSIFWFEKWSIVFLKAKVKGYTAIKFVFWENKNLLRYNANFVKFSLFFHVILPKCLNFSQKIPFWRKTNCRNEKFDVFSIRIKKIFRNLMKNWPFYNHLHFE